MTHERRSIKGTFWDCLGSPRMADSIDAQDQPTRAQVDAMPGPVLLEFGARWCGYCRSLAPRLQAMLERYPDVRHVKIEDGPGLPLGRSFRVTLWPNLVFLRDGAVVKQVARPDPGEVREGLDAITNQTESP